MKSVQQAFRAAKHIVDWFKSQPDTLFYVVAGAYQAAQLMHGSNGPEAVGNFFLCGTGYEAVRSLVWAARYFPAERKGHSSTEYIKNACAAGVASAGLLAASIGSLAMNSVNIYQVDAAGFFLLLAAGVGEMMRAPLTDQGIRLRDVPALYLDPKKGMWNRTFESGSDDSPRGGGGGPWRGTLVPVRVRRFDGPSR